MKPWYPKLVCGSVRLAAWRYSAIAAELGEDHPKAQAARGRLRALLGHLPGRHNDGPEHVAWQRERAGGRASAPGWMNRSERRALARRAS